MVLSVSLVLVLLAAAVAVAVVVAMRRRAQKVAVVKSLFLYPVKSCRWLQVDAWPVDKKGLHFDRQFLIVNASTHRFVTQRQNPKMVLIQPEIDTNNRVMLLSFPGLDKLVVPLDEPRAGELISARVWKDTCDTIDLGDEAAKWLQRALNMDVRLVRFCDDGKRPTEKGNADMRFPDQYPLLLCSQQAVEDIQQQVEGGETIIAQRFRPNILLGDCEAHAEDTWCGREVEINSIPITTIQHCARCRIPNIDPSIGELGDLANDKVSQAMQHYRKGSDIGVEADKKAVFFGQHAIPRRQGFIAVGDAVTLRGPQLIGLDDTPDKAQRTR